VGDDARSPREELRSVAGAQLDTTVVDALIGELDELPER
jgi:hypothetical protein